VVGIVANVKTTTVFQEMGYAEQPAVYRPLSQTAPESLAIMIAVNGTPLALVREIQQRISSIDANLILSAMDDLHTEQSAQLTQPRFRSVLMSGFAGLALALALVGLYGVLSQTVTRRARDIGIRMALGADRDRILRSVLGHACAMTIIGIVIGSAVAVAGIRVIQGMLYGIAARGAGELGVAAIALLVLTAGAASIPAYRAASIDPVRVLRDE
jgi:putative ABC transport system permease protein